MHLSVHLHVLDPWILIFPVWFFSLTDSKVLFSLKHFRISALKLHDNSILDTYFRSDNVSDRYYCSLFLPLQFRVIRESDEGPVGGLILEDICTCQGCWHSRCWNSPAGAWRGSALGSSRLLPPLFCLCCCASSHTLIHNEK